MLFISYMRITYSAPVDEAKHKSGHLGCEDYHDDDKKLNEKFREKHKILNPPKIYSMMKTVLTPKALKKGTETTTWTLLSIFDKIN